VLADVVDECDAALVSADATTEILESVRTAIVLAGVPDDDPLVLQLRAIEFEADRISVFARALLALPFTFWR
jgi:hypothetical protein